MDYYYMSPSKSFKSSAAPKASSQSDENAQNYQQIFHNPKKKMAKNYMSPTISAASKAISQGKKILTERNEGGVVESLISYTHDQKMGQIEIATPTVGNQVSDDESLSRTPKKSRTKNIMSASPRKKIISHTHDQIDHLLNPVASETYQVSGDESLSRTPKKTMTKNCKSVSPRKKIISHTHDQTDHLLNPVSNETYQVSDDESVSRTPKISMTQDCKSVSPTKKIISQIHDQKFDGQTDPLLIRVTDESNQVTDRESLSRTPKKPMTKNCMSMSPRKKTQDQKIDDRIDPLLNPVTDESSSQTKPPTPPPPVSRSKNDEEDAVFDDSSDRPYDPLTNYLSPRPRFLRYKPNRRRNVLFPKENGIQGTKDDGSTASRSGSSNEEAASNCNSLVSSPSSSAEGSVKHEDEEIDETGEEAEQTDDEESDDEEEERRWNWKGVLLKSLLLLVFLVLSASCISSMHPSTPVCNLEFPVAIKDGYYTIQNSTLDASLLKKLETGKFVLDQKEEKEMGFMEVNKEAIEKRIEEGNIIEAILVEKHETILPDFMDQERETEMLLFDEGMEKEEIVEDGNFVSKGHAGMLREVENFESGEIKGVKEAEAEKKGVVGELGEVEELENQGTKDVAYPMVENLMHQGIETAEKIESSNGYLTSSLSERHPRAFDMMHAFLENEVVVDSAEVYEDRAGEEEMVDSRMGSVGKFSNVAGEVVSERIDGDTTTGFGKIINLATVDDLMKELIKLTGKENLFKVLIGGVMMFSVIVVSLVLGLYYKHKDNSIKKDYFVEKKPFSGSVVVEPKKFIGKDSSPTWNPYSEAVVAENCPSVLLPTCGDEHLDQQLSSFRNSLSASFHLSEDASEEYYQSRAPTIEFLSEIEVGEVSSSLRSSVMKNKKTESEENNPSGSLQRKKMSRRGGDSVSVQDQPARSEFSSMDSLSYGSYTTEQKIKRKEEGRDGEVKVITTPLRRSSRIRNRAVTSP